MVEERKKFNYDKYADLGYESQGEFDDILKQLKREKERKEDEGYRMLDTIATYQNNPSWDPNLMKHLEKNIHCYLSGLSEYSSNQLRYIARKFCSLYNNGNMNSVKTFKTALYRNTLAFTRDENDAFWAVFTYAQIVQMVLCRIRLRTPNGIVLGVNRRDDIKREKNWRERHTLTNNDLKNINNILSKHKKEAEEEGKNYIDMTRVLNFQKGMLRSIIFLKLSKSYTRELIRNKSMTLEFALKYYDESRGNNLTLTQNQANALWNVFTKNHLCSILRSFMPEIESQNDKHNFDILFPQYLNEAIQLGL